MSTFSRFLQRYLSRPKDHRLVKRELARIARQYILNCETYDQKISRIRDDAGWAVLPTPAMREDSKQNALRERKKAWEYVAENGYDQAYFDNAVRHEARLIENMSWDAYRTMDRPDLQNA